MDAAGATAPGPRARSRGRRVLSWTLALVLIYLVWAILLFLAQGRMIFPGVGLQAPPGAADRVGGLRRFWLPVPGGRVEAWFLPPRAPGSAPALLFTHGNAELVDDWVDYMRDFPDRGVGVMLVEYPGYGRSEGVPSAVTLGAAVVAAYDTLVRQDEVDPARVVAWGRSVGGGPAALLVRERPVAALVLQSSFTSLGAFARRYLLPGFLVRHRFDVLEAVRAFDGPVLVIHGRHDRIIPYAHGRALAGAAADATLVTYECAHNDCPPSWSEHVGKVMGFLEEKGISR